MPWRFQLDNGSVHEEPDDIAYDVALQRARRANDPSSVNAPGPSAGSFGHGALITPEDFGDRFHAGLYGLAEVGGGLLDMLPANLGGNQFIPGPGDQIQEWAREGRRGALETISPEAIEATQQPGLFGVPGATPSGLANIGVESLPSLASVFVGGGGARALGAGPHAAEWVGRGIEGLLGAGGVSSGVEEIIRDFAATDPEGFIQSEYGIQALNATGGAYAPAVEIAAQRAKGIAPIIAGMVTTGAGSIGGRLFSSPTARVGLARAILTGYGKEFLEEFIQSGNEQLATNIDVRNVNQEHDVFEGVPESALLGGLLGGTMGAGFGGVQELLAPRTPAPAVTPPPVAPTVSPTPPTTPLAPVPAPVTSPAEDDEDEEFEDDDEDNGPCKPIT